MKKKNKKRYQQWIGKKQRLKRLLFYHSLIRYAYTFVILLSRYFMVIVKNEVYLISWDDFLFSFIAQMMPNKRFFFNFQMTNKRFLLLYMINFCVYRRWINHYQIATYFFSPAILFVFQFDFYPIPIWFCFYQRTN